MLSHTMPHVRVLHAVTNNKFHICKKLTGKYYNFAKRKGQRDSPEIINLVLTLKI